MQIRHEADEHAPFAHFVITTPVRIVARHGINSSNRNREMVTIGGDQFIICVFCKHWINRPVPDSCRCIASCHAEVRTQVTAR
jgi:hypothetical protein